MRPALIDATRTDRCDLQAQKLATKALQVTSSAKISSVAHLRVSKPIAAPLVPIAGLLPLVPIASAGLLAISPNCVTFCCSMCILNFDANTWPLACF